MDHTTPHVVVIGAGFGGVQVVRSLGSSPFRITLIDKTNHHLFQPLLYQVATAALSPADIAAPTRSILRPYSQVTFLLDEVIEIRPAARMLICRRSGTLHYDYLVVAPGVEPSYYGNDHWGTCAPGLKTLADALEIRQRILHAYEQAAIAASAEEAQEWTTFVIIGGGPTGVEVAGALAEIGRYTMTKDFPTLDPTTIRVILIEAGTQILPTFPAALSAKAAHALEQLGVELRCGCRAGDIRCNGVTLTTGESIAARTIIWAAGNRAPAMLQTLGVPLDRMGRVIVEADCSVPGYPEIFVIGDAACFRDPRRGELPGLAPVALQQGKFVAQILRRGFPPGKRPAFHYHDKGMLATIGRAKAVAALPFGLQLNGFLAWLLWAIVHIASLIRFRNRFAVLSEWVWYYLTYQPGARLLIERKTAA